jgi:alkyl hydroperoxide reductase subunit F
MMYDLTIIGGGPGGVSAGVYASRKQIKTLLVTESFGGQSIVSDGIENWIGTIKISGEELAKNMEAHLRAYAGDIVDIKTGSRVEKIEKKKDESGADYFEVTVSGAEPQTYQTRTILVATGSTRRKLDPSIKGSVEFDNKGVTYCATCDGPLFGGTDVVVVGGGNAAFESAAQLASYCKSVTILNRSDVYRADEVTVEKVLGKPNVAGIKNAQLLEVKGDKFVNGIVYKIVDPSGDTTKEKIEEKTVSAVFVEIGLIPTTSFVKDIVELDQIGKIVIDPWTQQSKTPGIWAAGDCTNVLYHQNNIASGDAVKALEDIYMHLHTR